VGIESFWKENKPTVIHGFPPQPKQHDRFMPVNWAQAAGTDEWNGMCFFCFFAVVIVFVSWKFGTIGQLCDVCTKYLFRKISLLVDCTARSSRIFGQMQSTLEALLHEGGNFSCNLLRNDDESIFRCETGCEDRGIFTRAIFTATCFTTPLRCKLPELHLVQRHETLRKLQLNSNYVVTNGQRKTTLPMITSSTR